MRETKPEAKATAVACANIAFIKYWGRVDSALNIPANGSVSMNLDSLTTTTTVLLDEALPGDALVINDVPTEGRALERVSRHLDAIRDVAGKRWRARVVSRNSFPMGAGMASSAAAYAALTVAAAGAFGLSLDTAQLSALARLGSGSACRSIPAGFVEWQQGHDHASSVAYSIAPPEHWALCDCIAVVAAGEKAVSSLQGHTMAHTSPLYPLRVRTTGPRVRDCREAILARDMVRLGEVTEVDNFMLHAIAMTSEPPIYYWSDETRRVLDAVLTWREQGLPVYLTLDAGPNVHCLCEQAHAEQVTQRLKALPGVLDVLVARPGAGAHLIDEHLIE
ncbi:MAG: diphosphomevalonate decarboxylase [Chloroflexi bacterium]|jgi:diphosphomevalonate decarboxylase|nr:diphosphomevalonate decarboxylase [Chloroflexota bacterium]